MTKCKNCQADNPDGRITCSNCGAILFDPEDTFKRTQPLCILFGDIVGFTSFSETLDPEFITNIINIFISKVKGIVEGHGGFINKLIGDEFMAVFGYPKFSDESILNAFESAREIVLFLREFDFRKVTSNALKRIHLRQGLESGNVTIGMDRENPYSLMIYGDTIFFASILEKEAEIDGIAVGKNAYKILKRAYELKPLEKDEISGYTYIDNG